MSKKLERWEAMLLLAESDREVNGDQRAIDLLREILMGEIESRHADEIPMDPERHSHEVVNFPSTWKNWALTTTYTKVTNGYLMSELARRGYQVEVHGAEPKLLPCDCCGYETITSDGWDVCPVCFWEDDATSLDGISGANGISLRVARENFNEFGAVDEESVKRLLPDGPRRFRRGSSPYF